MSQSSGGSASGPALFHLEGAAGTSLKDVGRAPAIADSLGVSQAFVLDDIGRASLEAMAKNLSLRPFLAAWAGRKKANAVAVYHDMEPLRMLEAELDAIQLERKANPVEKPGTLRIIESNLEARTRRYKDSWTGCKLYGTDHQAAMGLPATTTETWDLMDQYGYLSPLPISNPSKELQDNPARFVQDAIAGREARKLEHEEESKVWEEKSNNILQNQRKTLAERDEPLQFDSSLAQLAMDTILTASELAITGVADRVSGGMFTGVQSYGEKYLDYRLAGASPKEAEAAALGVAGSKMIIGKISMGSFFKTPKTGGLKQFARETLLGMGDNLIADSLEPFPEDFFDRWAMAKVEGRSESDVLRDFVNNLGNTFSRTPLGSLMSLSGRAGQHLDDEARAGQTRDFVKRQTRVHSLVEGAQTKRDAPDVLQDLLESRGMNENILVDAEALALLYQEGAWDLPSILGMTDAELMKAARAGRSIEVPLSRLHTRMDAKTIAPVLQNTRLTSKHYTLTELRNDDVLGRNKKELDETRDKMVADIRALDNSIENYRQRALETVEATPGLKALAVAEGGNVQAYVDTHIESMAAGSRRLAVAAGQPAKAVFDKLSAEGLQRAAGEPEAAMLQPGAKEMEHADNPPARDAKSCFPFAVHDSARGLLTTHSQGYLVSLFENADLSAIFHETAPAFFEEMDLAVREGIADRRLAHDLAGLRNWAGVSEGADLTIEQKQKLARGFEQYLRQGKAPSPELAGAFDRLKAWLKNVYESALDLDVELNDDVREIFGRMLTVEAEIAAVAGKYGVFEHIGNDATEPERTESNEGPEQVLGGGSAGPGQESALPGGPVTPPALPQKTALAMAANELYADRQKGLDAMQEQWRAEIGAGVDKLPVYAVLREISSGQKTADSGNPWLDAVAIRKEFGEEMPDKLRQKLGPDAVRDNGQTPEALAARHGFKDATEMLNILLMVPERQEAVNILVQEAQRAYNSSFDPAEYLARHRVMAEQAEGRGRHIAKALNKEFVPQALFAEMAAKHLTGMKTGQAADYEAFLAAARRADQNAARAMQRNDLDEALRQSDQSRLNVEMAAQAADLKKKVAASVDKIKTFIAMEKADPDARFIVMDMAVRYQILTYDQRLGKGRSMATVQKWLREQAEAGRPLRLDDRVMQRDQELSGVSVEEFERLDEAVNRIIAVEDTGRRASPVGGKAAPAPTFGGEPERQSTVRGGAKRRDGR